MHLKRDDNGHYLGRSQVQKGINQYGTRELNNSNQCCQFTLPVMDTQNLIKSLKVYEYCKNRKCRAIENSTIELILRTT